MNILTRSNILLASVIVFIIGCSGDKNEATSVNTTNNTEVPTFSDAPSPTATFLNKGKWYSNIDGCESSLDFFNVDQRIGFGFTSGERNIIGEIKFELRDNTTIQETWRIYLDIEVDNNETSCPQFENVRFGEGVVFFLVTENGTILRWIDGTDSSLIAVLTLNKDAQITTPADTQTNNYDKLSIMRQTQGLSKAFAIARFEAVFGSIDGGSGLSPDGSMPIYATDVITELFQFENELTLAQKNAALDLILPKSQVSDSKNNSRLLFSRNASPEYTDKANSASTRIGALLGTSLTIPVSSVDPLAFADPIEVINGQLEAGSQETAYVVTPTLKRRLIDSPGFNLADQGLKNTDSCWIVINEAATGLAVFGNLGVLEREQVITHEVMHCYEIQIAGDEMHLWASEGIASWAGQELVPGTSAINKQQWEEYESPTFDLLASKHSAVGFWAYLESYTANSLWTYVPAFYINASNQSGEDSLASILELAGGPFVMELWATFGALFSQWGAPWLSDQGPGGYSVTKLPKELSVAETVSIDFGSTGFYFINPDTNITEPSVFEIKSNGSGNLHWSESGSTMELGNNQSLRFCNNGPCVCSDGSIPEGTGELKIIPAMESLYIAIAGNIDRTPSTFSTSQTKVEDLCEQPTPTLPTSPSNNNTCLVGNWVLDYPDLSRQIKKNLIEIDPNNADINLGRFTGSVSISYKANGTANGIVDFSVIGDEDPEFIIITKALGDASFSWETNGNQYTSSNTESNIEFTFSAIVGGAEFDLPGTDTLFTEDDFFPGTKGVSAEYTCGDRSLVFFNEGANSVNPRYIRSI